MYIVKYIVFEMAQNEDVIYALEEQEDNNNNNNNANIILAHVNVIPLNYVNINDNAYIEEIIEIGWTHEENIEM